MIYFVTMHHNTDNFVNLQAQNIKNYTPEVFTKYKVYCGLSGVPDYRGEENNFTNYSFFNITEVMNQHWFRMNWLVDRIKENETIEDDDILVFLDGDAFPVDFWYPKIVELLKENEMVAADRREDIEPLLAEEMKPYPHPLFLATKAKFWIENELKWGIDESKGISTPGCLLKLWLEENDYSYAPLVRTNVFDIHPLFFGVYGDLIYHHGAASGLEKVYGSSDIWTRPDLSKKYGVALDIHVPAIPAFNGYMSNLVWQAIINLPNFINVYFRGKE
tara:strand:- start:13745 stop:14569 length:825 start_codon:yes stop_codon:yes gene_type:complete